MKLGKNAGYIGALLSEASMGEAVKESCVLSFING
jgi:hypothetical protein